MLEPALEHLRLVGLDRGQQVGRIEACGKRAPPRLDDRRSQSCRGSRWELANERAVGEQTLPASLQLSSAPQRIRVRSDSQPLRRHGSAMIALSTLPDFPASRPIPRPSAIGGNSAAALTRQELAPKAQPVTGVSEAVASSDRHARVDHGHRTRMAESGGYGVDRRRDRAAARRVPHDLGTPSGARHAVRRAREPSDARRPEGPERGGGYLVDELYLRVDVDRQVDAPPTAASPRVRGAAQRRAPRARAPCGRGDPRGAVRRRHVGDGGWTCASRVPAARQRRSQPGGRRLPGPATAPAGAR